MKIYFCWIILGCIIAFLGKAQDNYEIQVYPSPTAAKDAAMIELNNDIFKEKLVLRFYQYQLKFTHYLKHFQ
jgi:hypothetical protein